MDFLLDFQSVNSRGVVGSVDDNQEECKGISGFYTEPALPPGYSLVLQIPAGAHRIFIQQLKHSRNVLGTSAKIGMIGMIFRG